MAFLDTMDKQTPPSFPKGDRQMYITGEFCDAEVERTFRIFFSGYAMGVLEEWDS